MRSIEQGDTSWYKIAKSWCTYVNMMTYYFHKVKQLFTWSKPRKRMDRTRTVTSSPTPARNPAHSSATYDAPIMTVLPGLCSNENKSSLKQKEREYFLKIKLGQISLGNSYKVLTMNWGSAVLRKRSKFWLIFIAETCKYLWQSFHLS